MRTRVLSTVTAVFLAVTGASMTGCDPGILPSDGDQLQAFSFEGQSGKDSLRAGGRAIQRPIEDFVEAQGTFCLDFNTGCEKEEPPCDLFVPPVENFFAWFDPITEINCASVDYAGLADKWITEESGGDVSFGTEFSGSVTERPLEDGRAEVRVILRTTNALVWVMDEDCDVESPLLFGHRAPEVLDGVEAALGQSHLQVVFINTAPGADLPDLIQLVFCPEENPDQELLFIAIRATADGPLGEAFGVEDGTPGRMQLTQTGLFMSGFHGAVEDAFPAELIRLRVVGR